MIGLLLRSVLDLAQSLFYPSFGCIHGTRRYFIPRDEGGSNVTLTHVEASDSLYRTFV